MKAYHGTYSIDNIHSMLAGKSKPSGTAWGCSDYDDYIYVYPQDKIVEQEGLEDEDIEYITEVAVRRAFESAQIQAAFQGEDTIMYVVEFELPENILEDDTSCDNMEDVASCFDINDMSQVSIVKVWSCGFNKWHSPYVLAGFTGDGFESFNGFDLNEKLLKTAEIIAESGTFLEDIYEFDYEEQDVSFFTEVLAKVA